MESAGPLCPSALRGRLTNPHQQERAALRKHDITAEGALWARTVRGNAGCRLAHAEHWTGGWQESADGLRSGKGETGSEGVMVLPAGIGRLFPDEAAAEAWWRQIQCRLYTAASQLWHEEEDASTLLYGGEVIGVWSTVRLTGVVPRLHNALARDWRPPTIARLEGFLWSRLRFEYRTLLCAKAAPSPSPLPDIALEQLVDELASCPDARPMDGEAFLSLADERSVQGLREALAAKPDLLATLKTIADLIIESEDAGENLRDEGWRKRLLTKCAETMGVTQNTLHKRLERIRRTWPGR